MTFEPFRGSPRTAWRSSSWGCWEDPTVRERQEFGGGPRLTPGPPDGNRSEKYGKLINGQV